MRAEVLPAISHKWQKALLCVQSFKPSYDRLRDAGFRVEHDLAGDGFDLGLCLITKHKMENLSNLGRAWAALRPGGTLVCAGGKDVGIASIERAFKSVIAEPSSLSKHHCKILWGVRSDDVPPEISQWVDGGRLQIVPGTGCWSRPGVYNWNKVDAGSALLAEHLPGDLHGRVADLGAGWGYLSLKLMERHSDIVSLDLYEAEWLALEAAKTNLGRVAVTTRLGFHWHDVAKGLPEAAFDAVVTNPPFHEGKAVDIELGRKFITSAAKSLIAGGRLILVANRQLPYEATLNSNFSSFSVLQENSLYKVISARR